MTANHDLPRRVARYYETEPPLRAPEWVLQSALSTIETTPQRRGRTALRRYFDMPASMKLAAAAAVVIAVGAFALWQLAPPGPGGPAITAAPTPSPTPVPTPTARPGPTTYVEPALTEAFTSNFHGLSLSYPEGWSAQAATQPWARPGPFFFRDPMGDFFWDPARTDHLFLTAASQPLAGTPFTQWSTDFLAAEGCVPTGQVTIDGIEGVIGADCAQAFVSSGGRGYVFRLYVSRDDQELREFDWTAWLQEILATVRLSPQDAVDETPTASP